MKQDLQPGTVRDLQELVAVQFPDRQRDVIEYVRGRARARAAFVESLRGWGRTAARVAGVWAVSAIVAHDLVSIAEGEVRPGQWGAGGVLACVFIAAAVAIVLSIWVEDE